MSTRLQVILDDAEIDEFRRLAERAGLTLSEWVRQHLRAAAREAGAGDPARKLAALRRASQYSFPAPDIDEMLAEIERGYEDLP